MPYAQRPSRLSHVEGSIFSRMAADVRSHDALNLAQGYPDYEPSTALLEAFQWAMGRPQLHQYASPAGATVLRQAISAMFADLYAISVDVEDETTVTTGATQAIFLAVQALLAPGDEAIVFTPSFECYEPAVRLAGASPVMIALRGELRLPDWDAVESLLTSRTRLIIINSPHNPTGVCWSAEDMRRLEALAQARGLWVVSDEVYHNLSFGKSQHHCVWSFPGLVERSVIVGSLGKTLNVTGWRLGYAIAPPAVTQEIRKLQSYVTYAAATPLQFAAAKALTTPDSYRRSAALMQAKRDRFLAGLSRSRFQWRPSQGGYFQLLDFSEISDLRDVEFVDYLLTEHKIAGVPVSLFGASGGDTREVRFCIAKKDETLDRAVEILGAI